MHHHIFPLPRAALGLGVLLGLIACSDLGDPAVREPVCQVTPSSLAFGDVLIGESVARSFTVGNEGTAPLSFDLVSPCDEFAITSGGGSTTLDPGETRSVTITFAPLTPGPATCAIIVPSGCVLDLAGAGVTITVGAECERSATTLAFGEVQVGQSAESAFTLENVGSVEFSGLVVSLADEFTVVQGGGAFSLAAGQTREVRVRFTPVAVGPVSGSISTGADCGPVALTGVGTAPPTTVSFSTQIQPIFTASCATAGCHRGISPMAGLSLSEGESHDALVGVASTGYSPALRVAPGDPAASVLFNKISATGVYGQAMPPGSGGLPTAQAELIATWILEGAIDN